LKKKGETSSTNFDKLIAVNMKSVYLTSMIFGHHLMNNGGSIVNVSSIRAKTGTPSFSSSYAAAKAGVENLSKSFALELADKNIRVNAIAPGATFPTKMSINWSEEIKTEITNTVPLKRLGSPEDMANGVYFLVSDLSTYITGQTLNINGGAWMG
jgi:NAD(P)-dependent dehydrogenase (short-subunit alcohol dehydrogenase family)